MTLNIGSIDIDTDPELATGSGMAFAIYNEIASAFGPLPKDASPVERKQIRQNWVLLSSAISAGVINHLKRDPTTEADFAEAYSSGDEDSLFWQWLAGFAGVFTGWTPVPQDGGTALKTALTTWLETNPVPTELKGIIK